MVTYLHGRRRHVLYGGIAIVMALVMIFSLSSIAKADFTSKSVHAAPTNGSGSFTYNGVLFTHAPSYNYGPSIIQSGNTRQYWWCGGGVNPATGVATDVIFYRSYDISSGQYSPVQLVLSPSAGPNVWDEAYTCDPSVIEGQFVNPGNGQTYTYAMYYTGTDRGPNGIDAGTSLDGTNNRIGLAYSQDGVNWTKYAQNPVIFPQTYPTNTYGAGQPASYNGDGKAGIRIFHTDTSTSVGTRMWIRQTSDGIHFGNPTLITNQGMIPGQQQPGMANSDFAFDYQTNTFYAALALPGRPGDRETYHIGLYSLDANDFLSGQGTWTQLGLIDTNLTGSYLNHSPGLVRDIYGNVTPFLPNIEVVFSTGTNDPNTWNLSSATWSPNAPPPPPTPGSGATCSVQYVNSNQWNTGFAGNITITNTGSTPINGWTLVFTFPNNQQITQSWDSTYTQQGSKLRSPTSRIIVRSRQVGQPRQVSTPPGAAPTPIQPRLR